MSIKKLIFALSILFIVGSCAKEDTDKDPSEYTKDDFIGSYTFNYTYTSKKIIYQGFESGIDTTYSGVRTIFIEENDYCNDSNELSFVNLFGYAHEDCFTYSQNNYILKPYDSNGGEGKLEGKNLTIDISTTYSIEDENIKGTAVKN